MQWILLHCCVSNQVSLFMCELKTLLFIWLAFQCSLLGFINSDIISGHLLSVTDLGDVWRPRRIPRRGKKTHPPQRRPIHPAPVSQERQEHLMPHQQTTEQLLSSGCETPQLVLHAPPKILFWFYVEHKRD